MKHRLSRRRFLKLLAAGAATSAIGFPAILRASTKTRRAIVLGIDGMDPSLLERFMAAGKMPHASRLAAAGAFSRLRTSDPPQSPVAWSNFISGTNPGGHGIYDFIARHPETLEPYLSTSVAEGTTRNLPVGDWRIPMGGGRLRNLRSGATFWNNLQDHGVDSTVIRMPANFPPTPGHAKTLSGLGTPDIHGSYGIFTCFTTAKEESTRDVNGGRIEKVGLRNSIADCVLRGPLNTLKAGSPEVKLPFRVAIDPETPIARIHIDGSDVILRQGEWSPWVRVRFPLMPGLADVVTLCRFYLKSARTPFTLYVTPLNMDPESPALPLSTPADYARDLARRCGAFYTQGMPPDTNALSSGIFTDAEYRGQATFVLEEEQRLFRSELSRFRDGFFFFYFCSLDLNSHMFWRTLDPTHPAYTAELAREHGDFLPWLYAEMDRMIGEALAAADDRTLVMAVSDHGFAPFRRQFNLNGWLMDNGYASPVRGASRGKQAYFADVKWSSTQAYGLGINSLYLNLRGREPEGTVAAGTAADSLTRELSGRLKALKDPANGQPVISNVYRPADIYKGPRLKDAPDLLVCYHPGYRASWDTILGKYPREHFLDNKEPWSGDHAMDATFLPGTLLVNRPLAGSNPGLEDMAPAILDSFGVPVPADMTGKNPLG